MGYLCLRHNDFRITRAYRRRKYMKNKKNPTMKGANCGGNTNV